MNYKNFEVILVDNGSEDDSVDFVKNRYHEVIVLPIGDNLGLACASNRGAQASKGSYLFFLNNDTIVDQNIINALVEKAESDPKIGVCACDVFTYDGKDKIGMGLSCDRFGYPCGNLGPLFYPDAAIFIRRSVFDEISGFDDKLFLYGEDRDLCWRVLLQGYRIEPVKEAFFRHDSACTMIGMVKYKSNIWKRYLGERNLIRSMLKNYSTSWLFFMLFQYFILSMAELGLLLARGEFKVVRQAYIKAYAWNIKNFPNTWDEHKRIQRIRKVSDWFMRKQMARQIGKVQVLKWMGIPEFEAKVYKV
jgi:hypothetical protein